MNLEINNDCTCTWSIFLVCILLLYSLQCRNSTALFVEGLPFCLLSRSCLCGEGDLVHCQTWLGDFSCALILLLELVHEGVALVFSDLSLSGCHRSCLHVEATVYTFGPAE